MVGIGKIRLFSTPDKGRGIVRGGGVAEHKAFGIFFIGGIHEFNLHSVFGAGEFGRNEVLWRFG